MPQQNIKWYKVAESITELLIDSSNDMGEVVVNGKQICIAVHNSQAYACAAKCPHASGAMANGYVDALGNIVCPLHKYKFSLANGKNVSGEGYYLKTYPVQINEDGVFVGLSQKTSWW